MPAPAPRGQPLAVDDARRTVGARTLPVVLSGYAALLAADAGGSVRRTAAIVVLVLGALLVLAVASDVLPRALPVGRVPRLAGALLAAPVLASAVLACLALQRQRSLAGAVVLLAPVLGGGLTVAGVAGARTSDRLRAAGRVLGAGAVVLPVVLLAGYLGVAVTGLALPLALVPAHLLLVRMALPVGDRGS